MPKLPALKRLVLDGNDLRGRELTYLKEQPELIDLALGCPTLGDLFAKTGRDDLAATEWGKSLAEWQSELPTSRDPDKVAELEQKITNLKHRVAQQKPPAETNPR